MVEKLESLAGADMPLGTKWFPQAGLGLFLHWGISSVDGTLDISWGMWKNFEYSPGHARPEEYFALAKRFNPGRYNPEKMLSAAKDAGFRYAVLTTRHHDSYALWPSMYGEFNTRNYMGGRDLVREYVDACRKVGLKVGFYYSPPDFYSPRQYLGYGGWQEGKEAPQVMNDYIKAIVRGQLTELMTNYGKIDLIWFDGTWQDAVSREELRAMQPDIVIGRGEGSDFASRECVLPTEEDYRENLRGKWWEYCGEISNCWGYTSTDHWSVRSLDGIVEMFETARKYHGNCLLNIGPDSEGDFTELEYTRLREFGDYLKAHPELMPDWDE